MKLETPKVPTIVNNMLTNAHTVITLALMGEEHQQKGWCINR